MFESKLTTMLSSGILCMCLDVYAVFDTCDSYIFIHDDSFSHIS